MNIQVETTDANQTLEFARLVGARLRGGEVFELKSDIGGGKTVFVRGLVEGFGSKDPVASPSFTINLVYGRKDGKTFHHFDFYRLDDPGIMTRELGEVVNDEDVVTAVEWSDSVKDVLPKERVMVEIIAINENTRQITCHYPDNFAYLFSQEDFHEEKQKVTA